MKLSLVVPLAGCGRLQFDELRTIADAAEDASDSAPARLCDLPDIAPSAITSAARRSSTRRSTTTCR